MKAILITFTGEFTSSDEKTLDALLKVLVKNVNGDGVSQSSIKYLNDTEVGDIITAGILVGRATPAKKIIPIDQIVQEFCVDLRNNLSIISSEAPNFAELLTIAIARNDKLRAHKAAIKFLIETEYLPLPIGMILDKYDLRHLGDHLKIINKLIKLYQLWQTRRRKLRIRRNIRNVLNIRSWNLIKDQKMVELSKEHPYEDACKLLKISPVANYKSYKLSDETRNFIKLETIAKAIRGDWKPDLADENTVRYFIWGLVYTDHRSKESAGFLDVNSNLGLGLSTAYVGTSLEFKDEAQAECLESFVNLCCASICSIEMIMSDSNLTGKETPTKLCPTRNDIVDCSVCQHECKLRMIPKNSPSKEVPPEPLPAVIYY